MAPPRSGSTYLFECLAQLNQFTAFTHREAEHIWWRVLPYTERRQLSDLVEKEELDRKKRALLTASFYVEATRNNAHRQHRRLTTAERLGLTSIRYLDKTISNCFHLDALSDIFPDARLIFLVRDPRANIASMIEGWSNKKQFGKKALDQLVADSARYISHWSYPAPPGWFEQLQRSLPEICAWLWQQCVEHMLTYAPVQGSDDVVYVRYEDLLDNPRRSASVIARHLDMDCSGELATLLATAPASRTTVSPTRRDKWLLREREIDHVLPLVASTASAVGYDL